MNKDADRQSHLCLKQQSVLDGQPVWLLLLVSALLAIAAPAYADIHYVNADNAGPIAPYTNWPTAATNMSKATPVSAR